MTASAPAPRPFNGLAPFRARLTALGGLALESIPDGEVASSELQALQSLATRHRKLALLLYLARQTRPVSRELLATLLWADEPPANARHNLTEALSHIRRALGSDAIASRAKDVALSSNAPLVLDVAEFELACDQDNHLAAVKRYTGGFLAGEFVDRAPAFDDWASRERSRLHARFVTACEGAIAAFTEQGNAAAVAAVAQQWLDEDIEDARAAVVLLESTAHPGTREALRDALASAKRIQARLSGEYDTEPDPSVLAAARRIEEQLARLNSRVVGLDAPTAFEDTSPDANWRSMSPPDGNVPESLGVPESPKVATKPAHRRSIAKWALPAIVVIAVTTALIVRYRSGTQEGTTVRVLVATTEDPARDAVLDASLSMALGFALGQSPTIDVVAPARIHEVMRLMQKADTSRLDERTALEVAARIGADRVVVPSLSRFGDRRMLSARVLDVATGRMLFTDQASADNDGALLVALDELRKRLLRRLDARVSDNDLRRSLPDVTTASLGALRFYSEGVVYSGRAQYDSADLALRRAIALDSGFAMAYALHGEVLHIINRPADGNSALQAALSMRARLSERESMRIAALQARWNREPERAIAIQDQWLALRPNDRGTRAMLAFDMLHGKRHAEARDLYVQLLATDSLDDNAWINLATSASALRTPDNLALAQRAYAKVFALRPEFRMDVTTNHQFGSVLVDAGHPDSAAVVFRLMLNGAPPIQARGLRSLGLLALWQDNPSNAAVYFDSAATLHRAANEPLSEVRSRLLLARALQEAGQTLRGRNELETVRIVARQAITEPTIFYWAGTAMARSGMTAAAEEMLQVLRTHVAKGNRVHESTALLLAGEIDVARGRARAAVPLIRRGVSLDSTSLSVESLARALESAGDVANADSLFRVLGKAPRFGWEGTLAERAAARRGTDGDRAPGATLPTRKR